MQIGKLGTFLVLALGALAQEVRIIAPTPNTRIVAGSTFTTTVQFQDTTSSVDVLALFFGAKANDPANDDLGQTKLSVVDSPVFSSGSGSFTLNVDLTLPIDLINGLNRTYDLTCGEFYTLGAENTPSTFTSQVPLFVVSP